MKKRLSVFIFLVLLIFMFSSCSKNDVQTAEETSNKGEINTTIPSIPANNGKSGVETGEQNLNAADIYKNAASVTGKISASQALSMLDEISGDAKVKIFAGIANPIVKTALKNNSLAVSDIPGNYNGLCEEDIVSSAIENTGNVTKVYMKIKPQSTGLDSDGVSGSVGHAVGTLYDIAGEIENMGLPLEYSPENVSVMYDNCEIFVTIDNKSGKIVSGTWSCDVYFDFNDIKVYSFKIRKLNVSVRSVISM